MNFVIKAIIMSMIFFFVQAMLRRLIAQLQSGGTREFKRPTPPTAPKAAVMVRCQGCGTYVPSERATHHKTKGAVDFHLCLTCSGKEVRAAHG